jgi:hypothetical protein
VLVLFIWMDDGGRIILQDEFGCCMVIMILIWIKIKIIDRVGEKL